MIKQTSWLLSISLLIPSVGAAQTAAERAAVASPAREEHHGAAYVSPENIREIERVLQAQGYNPGAVEGVMDQNTVNAIRAFQQREGLRGTAVLNPGTVKRLVGKGASLPTNLADNMARKTPSGAQR
jgi:peptidoglycan hydrolase-like protein with peptidoglycan-binding domain